MKNLLFCIFFITISAGFSPADQERIQIGIDEQLGKILPVETTFNDEYGNPVKLKDLFTKPTMLAFVYYECPGICSPLMTAMAEVINKVNLEPGVDYNIVTISIDQFEKPGLAANKKRNYMNLIERSFPENAWRFLTGDSANIRKVTDAAGFYFKREGDQFIHSGALIFVSAEGKISRYLFPAFREDKGYSILPFDVKMAVNETAAGKSIPTVARVLQFCFSYDPEGKTYVLNFTRIFGAGIVILAVVFVLFVAIKPKKNSPNGNSSEGKKNE